MVKLLESYRSIKTSILIMVASTLLISCNFFSEENENDRIKTKTGVELVVLGTVQDAGSPQISCKKDCCKDLFINPDDTRKVSSLGLIDYDNQKTYLFDATPDMPRQIELLTNSVENNIPDGIFLTHAHIGHYTGLMFLGRESMGANQVPVFAMPRMTQFLENNGPWSQLLKLNNIKIQEIDSLEQIQLADNLSVVPVPVPHRDEFSETVAYFINGPNKRVLFIPDIDKWQKWDMDIKELIKEVDYAFLDGTFYDGEEINNRDISEIPHPFIIESMFLFKDLAPEEKSKIHFIHLNHTNLLLNENSLPYSNVLNEGFKIARYNQRNKI